MTATSLASCTWTPRTASVATRRRHSRCPARLAVVAPARTRSRRSRARSGRSASRWHGRLHVHQPHAPDRVTLIASWIPFENPQGPNFYRCGDNVLCEIKSAARIATRQFLRKRRFRPTCKSSGEPATSGFEASCSIQLSYGALGLKGEIGRRADFDASSPLC